MLPSLLGILGTGAPCFSFALDPASYVAGPGDQYMFVYSTCIGNIIFSLPNDPGLSLLGEFVFFPRYGLELPEPNSMPFALPQDGPQLITTTQCI